MCDVRAFVVAFPVIVVCFTWLAWGYTIADVAMFFKQKRALCLDGRLSNDTFSNATFQVDDMADGDAMTARMYCNIPVAVYSCTGDAGDPSSCYASAPIWRLRSEGSNTTCQYNKLSFFRGGACSDTLWDCEDGRKCNASSKAEGDCVKMMSRTFYDCYYKPDDTNGHVRTSSTSFPFGMLYLSVFLTIFGCLFCVLCYAPLIPQCYESCQRFFYQQLWDVGARGVGIVVVGAICGVGVLVAISFSSCVDPQRPVTKHVHDVRFFARHFSSAAANSTPSQKTSEDNMASALVNGVKSSVLDVLDQILAGAAFSVAAVVFLGCRHYLLRFIGILGTPEQLQDREQLHGDLREGDGQLE